MKLELFEIFLLKSIDCNAIELKWLVSSKLIRKFEFDFSVEQSFDQTLVDNESFTTKIFFPTEKKIHILRGKKLITSQIFII
jgi:hypothetical protein